MKKRVKKPERVSTEEMEWLITHMELHRSEMKDLVRGIENSINRVTKELERKFGDVNVNCVFAIMKLLDLLKTFERKYK